MNRNQKTVTEYKMDDDQSLVLQVEDDKTLVYHHHKKYETMKLVAKGPAPLENEESEVEKVMAALLKINSDGRQFSEKKLIENNLEIWKSCSSEAEFLAKIAYMVAGTIQKSYEEMKSDDTRKGFKLDEEDPEVASLKAMHTLAEILSSAESRNGAANAKAHFHEKPKF